MVELENKAGKFIKPTNESAQAALAAVELPENLNRLVAGSRRVEKSYPIVTYTWLLCYKQYSDPKKVEALKSVIEYGLTVGQKSSEQLGYVPLPQNVVSKVRAALNNIQAK